jgi:hypothetical protein
MANHLERLVNANAAATMLMTVHLVDSVTMSNRAPKTNIVPVRRAMIAVAEPFIYLGAEQSHVESTQTRVQRFAKLRAERQTRGSRT